MIKLIGLFVVCIFISSMVAPACMASSEVLDDPGLDRVVNFESSINSSVNETNDTEFFVNQLNESERNLFYYVKRTSGEEDPGIVLEIILMARKTLDPDSYNCFVAYATGSNTSRQAMQSNSFLAQKIGYINVKCKQWSNLTLSEKKSLFDNEKHDLGGACMLINKSSDEESFYINGCLLDDRHGYTRFATQLNRVVHLGSKAKSSDLELLSNISSEFADDIYNAHMNYIFTNHTFKENFQTKTVASFFNDSDKVDDMRSKLQLFIDTSETRLLDIDSIKDDCTTNGATMTTIGTASVIAGAVMILVGALGSLAGGAIFIVTGITLIATGVGLLATGGVASDKSLSYEPLYGKMKGVVDDFKYSCQFMIDRLNRDGAPYWDI